MQIRVRARGIRVAVAVAVCWFTATSGRVWMNEALAQGEEPIASIGHGAFFDGTGKEIRLTLEFVEKAQEWYRQDMLPGLNARQQRDFADFERRLSEGLTLQGQSRLVVRQRALEWLLVNSPKYRDDHRRSGKFRALEYALMWRLPAQADQAVATREEFKLDPDVAKRLGSAQFKPGGGVRVLSKTINSGQAYLDECRLARVPIPPPIGQMDPAGMTGWKSQGFIPIADQFIGQESGPSPAEVRTFVSATPRGMCYALPRYVDPRMATVKLDGVICLSQETSKVCIWDNQMSRMSFSFPAGTRIPIGVPDPMIDPMGRYQAGGAELERGGGGVCTDCHAGENPFITHPKSVLRPGVLWESLSSPPENLPTFSPYRYDPLVPAAWPQNQLSQARPTVPAVCSSCHVKGVAGRFPHLSNELFDYCNTILPNAYRRTMPPPPPLGNPGSQIAAAEAFRNAWCGGPPSSTSADAGDPHLTTTNGVPYDFQAAGEFVALKNSDTGFELQTRQSPVQTSFIPPANPHTGLASCASLNTALGVRAGAHRVTYQPAPGGPGTPGRMQLRIDGAVVEPRARIDLGDGNTIVKATGRDGVDFRIADGTTVAVTPRQWTPEGLWFLDVDVSGTPAREGILGPVLAGDWLPRAPDGTSFGPRPAALRDRHVLLNRTFAAAWRVSAAGSLFDYAPGTSTADFTDVNWPPESGRSCRTALPSNRPLERMQPDLAKAACQGIQDKAILENCLFDVTVMGDRGVAKGYVAADKRKTQSRR